MEHQDSPAYNISPEQWRWETTIRLTAHERKFEALHTGLKADMDMILGKLEALAKRLDPLEAMKAMLLGGLAVLIAIGIPLLWYVLSKVVPVIEQVHKTLPISHWPM